MHTISLISNRIRSITGLPGKLLQAVARREFQCSYIVAKKSLAGGKQKKNTPVIPIAETFRNKQVFRFYLTQLLGLFVICGEDRFINGSNKR